MQRTIPIEEDIYEFLRKHADFGETPSVVLRRLLPLRDEIAETIECPTCGKMTQSEKTFLIGGKTVRRLKCGHILSNEAPSPSTVGDNAPANGVAGEESALIRFITDPVFVSHNATDRYLGILGFGAKDKGEKFDRVLKVSGRRRKYIGSREEIELSGTSTHPRPIPNSRYWAMTNADNTQKSKMLTKFLRVLDYGLEEVRAAAKTIS